MRLVGGALGAVRSEFVPVASDVAGAKLEGGLGEVGSHAQASDVAQGAVLVTLRVGGAALTWLHGAGGRSERGAGVVPRESGSRLLRVVGVRGADSGPGMPHR